MQSKIEEEDIAMPSLESWSRFDDQTTIYPVTHIGTEPSVDHAASAKRNLEETLSDLWHAGPDKVLQAFQQARSAGGALEALLTGVFLGSGALVYDALEAPVMLVGALKDLADVAIHGTLAGLDRD